MKFENDLVRARHAGTLVLASSSERRRQLMTEAAYDFRVMPPKIAEDHLRTMPPQVLAESLAYAKARHVADALDRGLVVGADTVVSLADKVIGKAHDADEAREILTKLAGTTHEVITGLCVLNARRGERLIGAEITHIRMRPMSKREIEAYVVSGEGIGKAGAYAIQETGDRFVASIDGSFTNVVGLPMKLLADYLEVMEKLIYRD